MGSGRPQGSPNTHQPKKSPSNSVGAREVEWGREGLDGRPRPVPCAHLWGNALTPPAPGDHQGPPHIRPTALAPTDHPASCLSSRLRLMPITADVSALSVDVMVSAFKSYSALSRPPPIMSFNKLSGIPEQ